jgi:hypothetical protein
VFASIFMLTLAAPSCSIGSISLSKSGTWLYHLHPLHTYPASTHRVSRNQCSAILPMDQISIKTPNPKCRLFLKIDQERYLAAGVYLSEALAPISSPPPCYTLYEYMYPCTYSHREGGRGVDEPVRRLDGASSQEGSKIPT